MENSKELNSKVNVNGVRLLDYDGEGRIIQEVMHDDAPEYNKKEKINLNEEVY